MACPNKNLQSYKDLISAYGEGRALAVWEKNNEVIPTVEEAAVLLGIKGTTQYQLPSTEGKIVAEQTIRDIASRMSERIGMDVRFESDRSRQYKGKIDGNTAVINLAYATMDTPIHEILAHPIIRAIKNNQLSTDREDPETQNVKVVKYGTIYTHLIEQGYSYSEASEIAQKESGVYLTRLYQNLLKELESGTGKEVLDRIKRDYVTKLSIVKQPNNKYLIYNDTGYPKRHELDGLLLQFDTEKEAILYAKENYTLNNYTLEEQQEEALVELLGLMTANKLDAVKDGKLISLLKRLLKEIASYVKNLLSAKEIEIDKLPDNITINDLADILAYSNSKLILPGYEVVYTTPDNVSFTSYGEASKHIADLAKNTKDIDLDNITNSRYINTINPFNNKKIKNINFNYTRDVVGEGLFGEQILGNHSKEVTITYTDNSVFSYALQDIQPDNMSEKEADYYMDIYRNSENYIKDFIDRNKEFEQSEEIIEEWKKINGIKYNPEEIYSRGQGFYSVVGAYSDFDVNLMFQNILQHIEDNQKAGGEFVISAFTKPVDRKIGHLEGGGGKIKFVIYPQSEDIKWAANADVYSGSVWDAGLKVNKDKKSELLGVSYTKAPSLNNISAVKPNLAEIVDDLDHHHNELGIALTGKNFRIEYDDNIPQVTKKLLNNLNSILDQKFGKLDKPEIKKPSYTEEELAELKKLQNRVDVQEMHMENGVGDYQSLEDAKNKLVQYKKTLVKNVIQPTITSSNVKESIDSVTDKVVYNIPDFSTVTEFTRGARVYKKINGEWTLKIDGKPQPLRDVYDDPVKGEVEYIYNPEEDFRAISKEFGRKNKEYTSKALVNKKIAALKEVAKKYPRSLIRTEVRKISTGQYDYYANSPMFADDDLPFQKVPSSQPKLFNEPLAFNIAAKQISDYFGEFMEPVYEDGEYIGSKPVTMGKATLVKRMRERIASNPDYASVRIDDKTEPALVRIMSAKNPSGGWYQQLSSTGTPNPRITKRIDKFMKKLGGAIKRGPQLVVEGRIIEGVAVADVIEKTIQVADGKEGVDTLPEEAAHIYMHWLPDSSPIKQAMLRDIKRTLDYKRTLDEYGSNPLYQKADGTVDTDKIAIEAIGKRIAAVIVGKQDKLAQSWWQKLLNWVKNLFKNKVFEDAYDEAAEDILTGNVGKLDLAAIQEADSRGRFYLSLSPENSRYYNVLSKMATPEQKAVINDLVRNPRVKLDEDEETDKHEYAALEYGDTTDYRSLTSAMGVQGPPNPEDYKVNRQWGKDFDKLLKGIVENRDLADIAPTPTLSDAVREKLYVDMSNYILSKMAQGYIPLTQVSIADPKSGIADTIDLLLVSPRGVLQVVDLKTSWTSIGHPNYTLSEHPLKPDSVLRTTGRTALTKKQQQSTQVNGDSKILQIMGYTTKKPVTKHFHIVEYPNGVVTRYIEEAEVPHESTEMQIAVDTIIKTPIGTNNRLEEKGVAHVFDTKEYQQEQEKRVAEEPVPQFTADDQEKFRQEVSEVLRILYDYRGALVDTTKTKQAARNTAIQDINNITQNILIAAASRQFDVAYKEFLLYANAEIANMTAVLSNPKNFTNEKYPHWVTMAQMFVTHMQGALRITDTIKKDKEMSDLGIDLSVNITKAQSVLDNAARNIVSEHIIKPYTVNPLLTSQMILAMLDEMPDISDLDSKLGDIANSGNVVLENWDKRIKVALEKERKRSEQVKERLVQAADVLVKAAGTKDPKTLYDRMFQRYTSGPKKGQKTGRMISQTGQQYFDIQDRLVAALKNDDGTYKKQIDNPTTQEDKNYNIQLWKDRMALAQFQQGEILTWDVGNTWKTFVEQGRYHYLDPEYLSEISKYTTIKNGQRIPIDINNKDYKDFQNKYQEFIPETNKMIPDNNNKPTGVFAKDTTGTYVPKRQYIYVREVAADGTDMTDPEFKKLKNSTDKLGKAQWEFFKVYRDTLVTEIEDHLTPRELIWAQQNYIPAVASNFIQQMGREGAKKMEIALKEMKSWITVKGYTSQTDNQRMQGSLTESLPLMYTANLQSQERLDVIVAEIATHNQSGKGTPAWNTMSVKQKKEWQEKATMLKNDRLSEMNKITPEQIHPDLTTGLLSFLDMSSKFAVHNVIKDEASAIRSVLMAATYTKDSRNGSGKIIGRKNIDADKSNTIKRLDVYMQMIWQYDETASKETLDVIARKLMKLTSATGMAFNWLGHVHNVITGQINNRIDSFGGELYNRSSLRKMTGESAAAQLAFIKQQGEWAFKKKSTYAKRPAASKFEWLSREFNMVENVAANDPGRVNLFGDYGYATMEAGEFVLQSKTGNAVLDSIILTDKDGNEVSVYDAYIWDGKTNTATIKDGYTVQGRKFDAQEKARIHNRIRETNKKIHGNYRDIDKTAMERHAYGMLLMQYHKWIYPAFRSRFKRVKFDENLGAYGMWNEGRYNSAAAFVKGLMDKSISIDQAWKDTFKDMSELSEKDRLQYIRDNWEGLLTAENYKMFEEKVQTLDNRIAAHAETRPYTDPVQWQATMDELQQERAALPGIIEDMLTRLIVHKRNNLMKVGADLLYICILFSTFTILRMVADGLDDDDPFLKRLVNWATWEADRNLKEVELFTPLGIVESYQLIKNPIPALSAVRDFGQIVNAAILYPRQSDEERHLQRGPHEGELKLWKEISDMLPIYKQYNRYLGFDNVSTFFIK